MTRFGDLGRRLRGTLGREADGNLAEELRFHLDMESAALEKLGRSPAAARDEARRRLGGLDKYNEELRDVRGGRWAVAIQTRLSATGLVDI